MSLTSSKPMVIGALIALGVVGCAGSSNSLRTPFAKTTAESAPADSRDDSIQTASYTDSNVVTFTDKEALRLRTGPVDPNHATEFRSTGSGLRYRILRASKGRKPKSTDTVEVHYRGWLDNGREFDSSYDRGEPISFPLNGVVAGWTERMQLVGEGGMIELWIPSRLGYGARGSGASVPPYADLHFVVELLDVQ